MQTSGGTPPKLSDSDVAVLLLDVKHGDISSTAQRDLLLAALLKLQWRRKQ